IFKSWFVDFDPVHENVQAAAAGRPVPHPDFPAAFVDSALGPVPEGWRVGTLDNAAEIHDSKRIPLSKREREQRQGKYPYYGAASLMDYVDDYIFDGVHLLVAEDGSVIDDKNRPVLQYVWGQFWVNNHAHVLTGKNTCSTEQLMLAMKFINIKPYITGAVQLKINQANLKRIPFILPSAELNTKFKETVQFFYERIRTNTEESQTLAELRDTLLPQLISGHLRLPEIKETG
ncbi:MAG: restriction endonuclease subunit S, partial [Anaerolineales bacterium]|nr:restriction endonuclease subunit S [Anaerolineales bacterium]